MQLVVACELCEGFLEIGVVSGPGYSVAECAMKRPGNVRGKSCNANELAERCRWV